MSLLMNECTCSDMMMASVVDVMSISVNTFTDADRLHFGVHHDQHHGKYHDVMLQTLSHVVAVACMVIGFV